MAHQNGFSIVCWGWLKAQQNLNTWTSHSITDPLVMCIDWLPHDGHHAFQCLWTSKLHWVTTKTESIRFHPFMFVEKYHLYLHIVMSLNISCSHTSSMKSCSRCTQPHSTYPGFKLLLSESAHLCLLMFEVWITHIFLWPEVRIQLIS